MTKNPKMKLPTFVISWAYVLSHYTNKCFSFFRYYTKYIVFYSKIVVSSKPAAWSLKLTRKYIRAQVSAGNLCNVYGR